MPESDDNDDISGGSWNWSCAIDSGRASLLQGYEATTWRSLIVDLHQVHCNMTVVVEV